MKRNIVLLCSLAILLGFQTMSAQVSSPYLTSATDKRCQQWVDSILSGLSLREKVGQLIIATVPARNDGKNKKLVRELAKKNRVGGLLFTKGSPEEQAILTNLAQKSAQVPLLLTFAGEGGWAMPLENVPHYPSNAALGCIDNPRLIQDYAREVARQFRELGVFVAADLLRLSFFEPDCVTAPLLSQGVAIPRELLSANDVVLVQDNPKRAIDEWVNAVTSGKVSQQEVNERCRKVLTCKYLLGLRKAAPSLRVSGMSQRIRTEEAQALAGSLRKAAVTVLHNYFDLLPLTPVEGGIALLSIGEQGQDAAFAKALKKNISVSCFQLPRKVTEEAKGEILRQLSTYRRVVISLAGTSGVNEQEADFLANLSLQAPLVYTFFTPYRTLQSLTPALEKASAVVLAHSNEADVQQYVADVLLAKQPAQGKTPLSISQLFPAGAGCKIEPGMKPGAFVPEDYGMKSYVLHQVDLVAQKGLAAGAYPGCHILVLKEGVPIYNKSFGAHSDKDSTAVRPTDLFDLGSLTKTSATLLAVMKLYDQGKLKLTDKASQYLPFLAKSDKRNLTIRELLFHESGLSPFIRFYVDAINPNSVNGPYSQSWVDQWHHTQVSENSYYCSDFKFKSGLMENRRSSTHTLHVANDMWLNKSFKSTILQGIAKSDLNSKRYVYSDLGFVLLQQVVEALTKMPMNDYLNQEFYAPMGLQRTLFLPLDKFPQTEIMPTASNDYLRRQDLCGYVHDETAAFLGGVSGNAGLFSTAEEVGRIYQMLLNGGELDGKRYLNENTCRLFTTEKSAISHRGLGFDKPNAEDVKSSSCAANTPQAVYGHTGFTGTCAWVDPEHKTVYVFLSNRLCPKVWSTQLVDMKIRTRIQDLILKSLQ